MTGLVLATWINNAYLVILKICIYFSSFYLLIKLMLSQKAKIRLGYGVAILLLGISYGLIFYNGVQLNRQSGGISHSLLRINKIQEVVRSVTEAETSVRGYIIMNTDSTLELFYLSRQQLPGSIGELRSLLAEDKLKGIELDSLRYYITQRMGQLEFSIHAYRDAGMKLTPALIAMRPEVYRLNQQIRNISDEMIKEENIELDKKTFQYSESYRYAMNITLASLVIAILAIIFSRINYMRENKARSMADERARAYEKELEGNIQKLENINIELKELRANEKFAATGRVARTIAHEVRNPLTNISLANEQLKETEIYDPESNLLIEMISRNTIRINQLVSDLLNATRFIQLDMSRVDIREILEDSLAMANDRLSLRDVKLVRDYSPEDCFVMADSQKVKVAFLNIILNAIEAMEGKKGVLTLTTRKQDDKCQVTISDNGMGMDEETLLSLFEPFFTKKPKGNGMGLTNTQNIILNHKGRIFVKSEPGKGTDFIVYLDLAGS